LSDRLRRALGVFFLLVLIGLVSGTFGQLSRLFLLLTALPLLLLYLILSSRLKRSGIFPPLAISVVFFLVLPVHLIPWTGTAALLCSLATAALIESRSEKQEQHITKKGGGLVHSHLTVVFVVVLFQVALLSNPLFRPGIDHFFRKASLALTKVGGLPIPFGIFYFAPCLLLSVVLLGLMLPSLRQRIIAVILIAISVQAWFLFLPLLLRKALAGEFRAASPWFSRAAMFQLKGEKLSLNHLLSLFAEEHSPLLLGLFLAVFLALIIVMSEKDQPLKLRALSFQTKNPILVSILIITILAGLLAGWSTAPEVYSHEHISGRKCAVLVSNISMAIPQHGNYGHRSVGMFGRLPDELMAIGLEVNEIYSIAELGNDHELLLLINLQENFSAPDKTKIVNWIRDGGRLLVLTDHTGDEGLRLPVNHLLEDTGLVVNFDTAKAKRASDVPEFEFLINSPVFSIGDALLYGGDNYGTGASISTKENAMPLLQKRYCFIDPGSFTAVDRGCLGNLSYDLGEPLGNITLAGIASFGKGKVALFGDTSPFQNGAWSQARDFNTQIIGMLLDRKSPSLKPTLAFWVAVVPFLFLIGGLLFLSVPRTVYYCIFPFSTSLIIGMLFFSQNLQPGKFYGKTPIAMIDIRHIPYIGKMSWTATDMAGLETGLLREGFIVALNNAPLDKRLEPGLDPHLLILPAPLARFSSKEISSVKSFVERGGMLIINIGFDESENAAAILRAFDLVVSDIPLGSTLDTILYPDANHVNFFNAWQVNGEGEVLARVLQCPSVIRKKFGKGNITLIGDSKFFWNANLEGMEAHRPGNIRFLTKLVSPDHLTDNESHLRTKEHE